MQVLAFGAVRPIRQQPIRFGTAILEPPDLKADPGQAFYAQHLTPLFAPTATMPFQVRLRQQLADFLMASGGELRDKIVILLSFDDDKRDATLKKLLEPIRDRQHLFIGALGHDDWHGPHWDDLANNMRDIVRYNLELFRADPTYGQSFVERLSKALAAEDNHTHGATQRQFKRAMGL